MTGVAAPDCTNSGRAAPQGNTARRRVVSVKAAFCTDFMQHCYGANRAQRCAEAHQRRATSAVRLLASVFQK